MHARYVGDYFYIRIADHRFDSFVSARHLDGLARDERRSVVLSERLVHLRDNLRYKLVHLGHLLRELRLKLTEVLSLRGGGRCVHAFDRKEKPADLLVQPGAAAKARSVGGARYRAQ
jgi:hypothetical protein